MPGSRATLPNIITVARIAACPAVFFLAIAPGVGARSWAFVLFVAAGLSDIGHYFPNTDPHYKDIDSQILLKEVVNLIRKKGYAIINIDASLIAEKPKISDRLHAMKTTLANSTGLPIDNIGLKATTNEGVDDIGKGLAIAAHAVCLITIS